MKFSIFRKVTASLIFIIVLAGCAPLLATEDPAIVLDRYDLAVNRYNQLKAGMTYSNIAQIMGGPGEESQISTPEGTTDHPAVPQLPPGTAWVFEQGGCVIRVGLLRPDRTISIKSFTWPEINNMPKRNHRTTLAQFDRVTVGMPYDEVVSTLGSTGMLFWSTEFFHLAGSRADSYVWWPEGKSDATISNTLIVHFKDGVVDYKK